MSPSSSGLIFFPLLIWHASLGLGPSRSADLKSSMQRPNESSPSTQTKGQTKQAGNTRFLELLIVPNTSINHRSSLESTFTLDKRVISHPWEHINLQIAGYYTHVSGYVHNWQSFPLILLQQCENIGRCTFCLRRWHEEQWVEPRRSPRGSPCWVSAVIESGLSLSTEDGVWVNCLR